jgi:hypothetical protein
MRILSEHPEEADGCNREQNVAQDDTKDGAHSLQVNLCVASWGSAPGLLVGARPERST